MTEIKKLKVRYTLEETIRMLDPMLTLDGDSRSIGQRIRDGVDELRSSLISKIEGEKRTLPSYEGNLTEKQIAFYAHDKGFNSALDKVLEIIREHD